MALLSVGIVEKMYCKYSYSTRYCKKSGIRAPPPTEIKSSLEYCNTTGSVFVFTQGFPILIRINIKGNFCELR